MSCRCRPTVFGFPLRPPEAVQRRDLLELVSRAGLDASELLDASLDPADPDAPMGADAVPFRVDPERTAAMLGSVLAALHRVGPPDEASSSARPAMQGAVDRAREVLGNGDGAPLDPAYAHMERERLVSILEEGLDELGQPGAVVSHGRPTLSRLVCVQGRPVGFVDWRRLELADSHRDLAAAATDVAATLGPMAVPLLFDAYGADPDPRRLDWWVLAHQLARRIPNR